MGCCPLEKGCCGGAIRTMVNCGFFHYVLHGLFVLIFVFTNTSYPSFYYVDYIFGGSGGCLAAVAITGMVIASLKNCQFIRACWAILVVLNVFLVVGACYFYTLERWNDVIVTAITKLTRKPMVRDFPDTLWFTMTVLCCIVSPFLLLYLIYIVSYMCNKWKLYLFTDASDSNYGIMRYTTVSVPKTPRSNAYPVQRL